MTENGGLQCHSAVALCTIPLSDNGLCHIGLSIDCVWVIPLTGGGVVPLCCSRTLYISLCRTMASTMSVCLALAYLISSMSLSALSSCCFNSVVLVMMGNRKKEKVGPSTKIELHCEENDITNQSQEPSLPSQVPI